MREPVGEHLAHKDPALRAAFSRVEKTGRRGSVGSLNEALASYLAASGLTRRRGESPIFQAFERACGPTIARRARPVKIQRGVLTVEVDSAPLLAELEAFRGEELRERVNQDLGGASIRRITFRTRS